jgi:regulator of CtrA degradation
MTSPDQAFIEKFYQEAMALMQESREYMTQQADQDLNSLSPEYALHIGSEITRVTTRLTDIMAWLLLHRASRGTSYLRLHKPSPKLNADETCLEDSTATSLYPLPHQLHQLLDETRNLYLRLLRLEQMGRE